MDVMVAKRRFTVDEYYRMAQVGILSSRDRVELIDGEIVLMTPVGARHAGCLTSATYALIRAAGDDAIVRSQAPVRLDVHYEPEPDLALLRPRSDFYTSRHAGPGDVLLIVEIADSSIGYDRHVKAPLYAMSGIPEYWIADLNANVLWKYAAPDRGRYQRVEECRRGQSIAPQLLPSCVVPVDAFLTEPIT
jgi:Uma2 family endonuclease